MTSEESYNLSWLRYINMYRLRIRYSWIMYIHFFHVYYGLCYVSPSTSSKELS